MKSLLVFLLPLLLLSSCATQKQLSFRSLAEGLSTGLAESEANLSKLETLAIKAPPHYRAAAEAGVASRKKLLAREQALAAKLTPFVQQLALLQQPRDKTSDQHLKEVATSVAASKRLSGIFATEWMDFGKLLIAEGDRFDRDYSHLGGKVVADNYRKEGRDTLVTGHRMSLFFRGFSEGAERTLTNLSKRKDKWVVVKGKVSFTDPAAEADFRREQSVR